MKTILCPKYFYMASVLSWSQNQIVYKYVMSNYFQAQESL